MSLRASLTLKPYSFMHGKRVCVMFLVSLVVIRSPAQLFPVPEPQPASIAGQVVDADGGLIPGVKLVADGLTPNHRRSAVTDSSGAFLLEKLIPAVPYKLTFSAKGFSELTIPAIVLTPGQRMELSATKLAVAVSETTVTAVSMEQLATEQVKTEEKQRILGIIPNFYVVYDSQFVPLTPKLKFKLAFRASTDVITFAGTAFISGINQAADTPAYQQGWKGYGQRFGAVYASSFSDIMIGGALLPSALHQDPRYFYQGTGSNKSRALHALEAPFVAKGDNGQWQPNYSSLGGDLASSALATTYYPEKDRNAGTVLTNAAVTTIGRIANAMAQEFLFSRLAKRDNKTP